MLTTTLNIHPVRAGGTIYIRADGSIDPPTANITTVDNLTYTFTYSNYDEIVVERDNVTLSGAGYTLQGMGNISTSYTYGILLSGRSNVTIRDVVIRDFRYGIGIYGSARETLTSPIFNHTRK
jgi:hypothetical protein